MQGLFVKNSSQFWTLIISNSKKHSSFLCGLCELCGKNKTSNHRDHRAHRENGLAIQYEPSKTLQIFLIKSPCYLCDGRGHDL